jgi:hypothetical protein
MLALLLVGSQSYNPDEMLTLVDVAWALTSWMSEDTLLDSHNDTQNRPKKVSCLVSI